MFCVKCGNEMADDSKFCMKCGTRVNVAPEKEAIANTLQDN